jgi:hypothetical protein
VNNRLRKIGLQPVPPGVSPWRDNVKVAAFTGLESARTLLHSRHAKAALN